MRRVLFAAGVLFAVTMVAPLTLSSVRRLGTEDSGDGGDSGDEAGQDQAFAYS